MCHKSSTSVLEWPRMWHIWMSHWRRRATEGADFWISCKQPAFLSSFSCLQLIQNLAPYVTRQRQCDILLNNNWINAKYRQICIPITVRWRSDQAKPAIFWNPWSNKSEWWPPERDNPWNLWFSSWINRVMQLEGWRVGLVTLARPEFGSLVYPFPTWGGGGRLCQPHYFLLTWIWKSSSILMSKFCTHIVLIPTTTSGT